MTSGLGLTDSENESVHELDHDGMSVGTSINFKNIRRMSTMPLDLNSQASDKNSMDWILNHGGDMTDKQKR